VAETFGPGGTVHGVARRSGVSPSQLFAWRKLYRNRRLMGTLRAC
jgi:transposase-like protein